MDGDRAESPAPSSAPAVETLRCTSCGSALNLRAKGQSLTLACAACGALLDASNESYRIVGKQASGAKFPPIIPLGRRGRLGNDSFEVIGFMIRSESIYQWQEYLLWNPRRGFRWLNQYKGHWTLFETIHDKPKEFVGLGQYVRHDGREYRLFGHGNAKVIYVAGEFYWRVKIGNSTKVIDYVCPPRALSVERDHEESVWSLGTYLEPDEVRDAFQLEKSLRWRVGVGPCQPSPLDGVWPTVMQRSAWFMAAMMLIYLLASGRDGPDVLQQKLHFNSAVSRELESQGFDIDGSGNVVVELDLGSSFENRWADFDVTLVREETGELFNSGIEIVSEGSEGSQRGRIVFPGVAPGRYHVDLELDVDPGRSLIPGPTRLSFDMRVRRAVTIWSNTILAVMALALFPAMLWWREHSFEVQRWSESDYSPFQSDDE